MIQILWDTRGYFFWLLVVSVLCLVFEALWPWRREQKRWRDQFGQDIFWLIFNGHYAGLAISMVTAYLGSLVFPDFFTRLQQVHLLGQAPLWVQVIVFFIIKDFAEWWVHRLLHRVGWLWEFHKLHHAIVQMDFIGNFRFHWMEIVIYKTLTYLPLVVLGVNGRVILWIAIFGTLIGHLNHSNLNLSWGPLRYLLNSPRMHIWHHAHTLPHDHPHGMNFGICLSLWDWLFGTAYWPDQQVSPTQQPDRLGFEDIQQFPRSLWGRLIYPFYKRRR